LIRDFFLSGRAQVKGRNAYNAYADSKGIELWRERI